MASNTSDDGSKCPICFEIYKEPKALACLHTFCKTCIHEYILKSKEKGLLCDGIECPLCRFVTTVDKDELPETWAESLRANFALASLLESTTFSPKSAEKDERLCQPCLKHNNSKSATIFCSVCNERLCSECKKVHDSLEFTKNHESVAIEKSDNVEFLSTLQTFQRCEQHNKKVKFYCKDEDKLCCSTCAIIAHRECKGLVEINEIAKDKSSSIQSSILSKQMSELENTMKLSAAHFVSESKKLTTQGAELMDGLKQLREKVNQRFDELEDKVKGEMKEVQIAKASEVMANAVNCDQIASEMHRLLRILELSKENGTDDQIFIVVNKLKNEFVRQKYQTDKNFSELESLTLSLTLSKPIEDVLNTSIEFASLSVERKTDVLPRCVAKQFTLLAEINIEQGTREEYEPWYCGVGFLNDGRIVAVDFHNKKCVIMNDTLEKLGEHSLPVTPFNLSVTNDNCVIITTGLDKKLCIYQVDENNTLTEKEIIIVTHKIDSLSVVDNNKFVVGTYGDTSPVHELNLSGKVTDLDIHFEGKTFSSADVFKCCYSEGTKQLLITDTEANAVYICNCINGEIATFKHDSLVKPRESSHYMNDVFFICSSETNSIVQFASSGKVLAVNKIDMRLPHSICVSPDKDRLLVSNSQKGVKKLFLFKVKKV